MIYLDNFASTPVADEVIKTINNTMQNHFANPHSVSHELGWESADIIEDSARMVAKTVGAKATDVIFTSGATESNNTIIKCLDFTEGKKTILVSAIEHPCVLQSANFMESHGFNVKYIPVDNVGRIDMNALYEMLDDTVGLVSVMLVNNEIGTIQDIKTIADKVHSVGAILHSDCAQAVGKIKVNMKEMGVDALSLSGHKFYCAKGIGALVINDKIKLNPLIVGGGQQKNIRSGTAPTPLIAGLSKACELVDKNLDDDIKNISVLRDKMENDLLSAIDGAVSLGDKDNRIAGSINLYVPNIFTDNFFVHLKGVALSSGSACASAGKKASDTLQAIGISPETEALSIRICISNKNTADEVKTATDNIISAVKASKNQ
ncbi:MAG: cysteine desulfurase family protein [Alphaproteobacteria bacterium]